MTPAALKNELINSKIQVIELDKSGIIISSEDTFLNFPVKKSITSIHPFFEGIQTLLSGITDTLKFPCVNIQNEPTLLILDIDIVPNDGGFLLVLFDFTDHYKESHPLVQEKNESAIQKHKLAFERNLLVAKEEFKNNFLAHLNHEIRNPLNNLMGFMEILSSSKLNYEQKETLNVMQKTGMHLKVLMDDLLDISKIERGVTNVKHVNFNLGHIINNLQNHFGLKYSKSGVALEFNIAKDVPTKLIGDPVRVNQILFNLLENAFRNTSEGAIQVLVSLKDKVGKDKKVFINFNISDTGVGIPEHQIDEVFDSYFQLELNKIKPVGQGLGLKIVKDLTGLLNGNIQVASKEQEGTSFNITIPFEIRDVREKRKSVPKGSGIVLSKRILIIEDEEINQMLFMKTFINNEKGYQLEMAQNGDHAFELLNNKKYDAIILKRTLTDMDALEFIEKLRSNPNELIATMPVLMASGSTMLDEQERLLSAGATAFLPKPYTKRELFKILEKVIQN